MSNKRRKRGRRNREQTTAGASGQSRQKADLEAPAPTSETAPSPAVSHVGNASQAAGPNVVVAFASTGRIHEQTLGSMQTMIRATRSAASVEMWWQNAYPGGRCRNLLVDRFLADKSKTHLLFVDTDMVVPEGGLDLLLETNEPLVCGPAPICRPGDGDASTSCKTPTDLTTNIMDADDPDLMDAAVEPQDPSVAYRSRRPGEIPDSLFTCDVTGMSFCLIAREVLERMTPPWFYFVDLPDRTTIGVDVYFFRKARQLGYRVAVHPQAWCDHIKSADLTRIEGLLGTVAPEPQWDWTPCGETPRTMVVACTSSHWLDFRTAEVLIRWQEEPGGRIGVRLFEAADVGWALARWLLEPTAGDASWDRVMLLGPDIVPPQDLAARLGSIDAPIVSALSRGLIDGTIAYTFSRLDPVTGRTEYPSQLPLAEITEPFPAHVVDLSCAVIKRDYCGHVTRALSFAASQADPTRAFDQRFCDLVREETGSDPVVAPICVERTADVGLLGLLKLKHQAFTNQQTQPDHLQPAGV